MEKKKITPAQLAKWKKEHHAIYEVTVGAKKAIIASPSWSTWKQAVHAIQKNDSVSYAAAIINNGHLAGDAINSDVDLLNVKGQIDEILEFADATLERVDNHYLIKVEDKVFKCKPVTREVLNLAERDNAERKPFVTNESILNSILLEGDEEVLRTKNPYYYQPLLAEVEQLHEHKAVRIKKL